MRKHFKYLSYVVRHKYFVFVAGLKIGASWWRMLVHDLSKFSASEWSPYVRYFYGDRKLYEWADAKGKYIPGYTGRGLKQVKAEFDAAWLHHQHLNPHHWQYWVLRMDSGDTLALNMPETYIREMVADWMGAGRAITGKWEADEWYEKNKGKMLLTEYTRERVEELLGSN